MFQENRNFGVAVVSTEFLIGDAIAKYFERGFYVGSGQQRCGLFRGERQHQIAKRDQLVAVGGALIGRLVIRAETDGAQPR